MKNRNAPPPIQALLASLVLWLALPFNSWAEQVELETDLGKIVIELYSDKAPVTTANFLKYVDSHFYDGTIFHRVIANFVVQGGGLRYDFTQKETNDPIVNESSNGLLNRRGTLSMARYSDPDSATSQFFINLKDNTNLDPKANKAGYTVFGEVIQGMAVVEAIVAEPQGLYRNYPNAPNAPVRILKAKRLP
ncbi:peptidylprolyl isomerase [Halioxenophilus sp. WMMB6]|uniref:peptidylprolyl isomerase n=1 Tax=Halioxenophilus sp. WMMB6 TaxID=3073815 RepID=UPI00295E6FB4|nr:peptidylprolyl isomerase [Halioxenophilus sp. WMMB6]